jgi:hypothetical protein
MAYSELVKRTPVSVVETGTFVRQVDALLSTSSREESIGFLAFNPEAGDAIAGTGGSLRRSRRPFGKGTWRGDDGECG